MATDLFENIVVAKVTSMFVLGGTAFTIIMLPVLIGKRISSKTSSEAQRGVDRSNFTLSLFLAFGGGVLLCTAFLHLLPEVTENIEKLQSEGKLPDFPLSLAPLIMCCGFFVMYIVEEVVHKFIHSRYKAQSLAGCNNPINVSSEDLVATDKAMVESYKEIIKQDVFQVTFSHPGEEDMKIFPPGVKNYGSSCSHSPREEVNHNQCYGGGLDSHYDHDHRPRDHSPHHHNTESGAHPLIVTNAIPSLREFLLVLALTVHESFEGLAIGLEDKANSVWYLMLAVAVHKSVIAFCVGVELVSGHVKFGLSVFYSLVFACSSPFGICAGLLLTTADSGSVTVLLSVILQGMATGTLVYVVFFEILGKGSHSEGGLSQMFVVILGFVVMAVVMVVMDA